VFCCLGAATGVAVGEDWPTFGGSPARNMANTVAKNIPEDWSVKEGEQKNIKWTAQLGTTSYGGPVIAGGRVFVGTNNGKPRNPQIKGDKGVLMCFRESDGQFLWQAVHDKLPDPNENDWPEQGIPGTPTVDGDHVYYVNNRAEVVCATTAGNPQTHEAQIVWKTDLVKDLKVYPHMIASSSPLVVGEQVFVVTSHGVEGEKHTVLTPTAPSFVALNKKTGAVLWQDASPGKDILEGQWSSPTYAVVKGKPQVIFPGGDGWLRGFDAQTHQLIWKFDCNPKKSVFHPGRRSTRNYIVATPVVYDDKVYVGVGQNPDNTPGVGHFWCIDITRTGDLSPREDNFDPKAAVNKDSGLVWHYGGEIMSEPKRGRKVVFGLTTSTCAIHGDLVYVAEVEGYMHCLSARTGELYWTYDFKANIWGSPLWVDGKVYIGTDDGDICIFKDGKVKQEPHKVEMENPIKSPPVVANGVLYILTDKQLYAIAAKK
jgi:outer membrane protein assembly factor BamB